jgi:hypothetical protein
VLRDARLYPDCGLTYSAIIDPSKRPRSLSGRFLCRVVMLRAGHRSSSCVGVGCRSDTALAHAGNQGSAGRDKECRPPGNGGRLALAFRARLVSIHAGIATSSVPVLRHGGRMVHAARTLDAAPWSGWRSTGPALQRRTCDRCLPPLDRQPAACTGLCPSLPGQWLHPGNTKSAVAAARGQRVTGACGRL